MLAKRLVPGAQNEGEEHAIAKGDGRNEGERLGLNHRIGPKSQNEQRGHEGEGRRGHAQISDRSAGGDADRDG